MEIDQDIPLGNSKPTTLSSVSKKPLNKKPILIGVGIVLVIVVIALLVMFVLPNIDFTPVVPDDNTPVEPVTFSCEQRLNLNIPGITAVFANSDKTSSIISAKGEKASYIQLSEGKVIIEVIENTFADQNDPESDIITLLKSKNVSAVAVADAGQTMKNELHNAGIKCYNVGGTIASLIGEVEIVVDTSFCKKLGKYSDINGKVAFASNSDNSSSIVSAKGPQSPYFVIYQDTNFLGAITNTAVDSTNAEDDLITLLQSEGIDIVIMASFGETMETKLQGTGIKCYEAGGTITSVVGTG